jgi:chondroitin 4-sulfotransferase 11
MEDCEDYQNWFKFTFVRNPWDRVISTFHYRKKAIKTRNKNPHWPSREEIKNDDFKATVLKDLNNKNSATHYLEEPCFFNWWINSKTISQFDYIGKTETLQEDFDAICRLVKLPPLKLPHKNKTKHKHYTEYYDDETKQIVAEKYAKDIEYFGYKFGE